MKNTKKSRVFGKIAYVFNITKDMPHKSIIYGGNAMENPFVPIYRACNTGNNADKYQLILDKKIQLPRYIDVELTNVCNFNCRFCPTGTKATKRVHGFMSDEVLNVIAENVSRYRIPGVRFIRWGEPTLHPQWLSAIEKMKVAGALTHINTNGALLKDEDLQNIIDMKLDSIKFSFQGADEGTYNEMRLGGNYKDLLACVRRLFEMRKDKLPYIQISTTLTGETVEQIEAFKKDIEGCCDYYNIGYTKLSHLDIEAMNVSEEEKNKIKKLKETETNPHRKHAVCMEAFDKLSINWNGDVSLCCGDYDNYMLIGNILDMDLKQLFTCKAANQYRKMLVDNEYNKIYICSTCYETVPLQK